MDNSKRATAQIRYSGIISNSKLEVLKQKLLTEQFWGFTAYLEIYCLYTEIGIYLA